MAFFLEGKRNTDFPVNKTPSPFQYQVQSHRALPSGYAPFGSTSRLERTTKLKQDKDDKKKIEQKDDQNIFVIEDRVMQMEEDKMHSMFKSKSSRFMNNKKEYVPGPGAYQLRSKYKNQYQKKQTNSMHTSIMQLSRKINPPSIPTDNLGYKCDSNNEIQKVEPKAMKPPVPGSYDIKKDLIKQNGLAWTTNKTMSRKEDEEGLPGPGQYNPKKINNHTVSSCFKSGNDRFNPKKIKKNYYPGPGDYNPEFNRPQRQFSQSHFNSKAMRFAPTKSSNLGPGSYLKQKSRSLTKFRANSTITGLNTGETTVDKVLPNRNTIFNMKNKNPGPGQYIVKDGMTFQLQKALLRKHNMSQFPNQRRQVFQPQDDDQPGPGAYNPEKIKQVEKGNLGYKKVEIVNLKDEEPIQSPSPFNYNNNNHTIAKKISSETKRLTLTDMKPFNVGSNRFPHYTHKKPQPETDRKGTYETDNQSDVDNHTGNMKFTDLKKTKKLIMTSIKVKVPFGSSTSKHTEKQFATPIGPGQYETGDMWMKQSHSIKGKL